MPPPRRAVLVDELRADALDQMVEKFHLTDTNGAAPEAKSDRINLLNWDGNGSPEGLFPDRPTPDDSSNSKASS